jgi:hypothetical protein
MFTKYSIRCNSTLYSETFSWILNLCNLPRGNSFLYICCLCWELSYDIASFWLYHIAQQPGRGPVPHGCHHIMQYFCIGLCWSNGYQCSHLTLHNASQFVLHHVGQMSICVVIRQKQFTMECINIALYWSDDCLLQSLDSTYYITTPQWGLISVQQWSYHIKG